MAVRKGKIRAKRARARQRDAQHDVRPRYRAGDLPATAHIGVMTFEDPYAEAGRVDNAGNLVVEAQPEPVLHRDGSLSQGAPAWTPPQRPRLPAIMNLREDAIGRMHARHQVDTAQYQPARAYQRLHEVATLGSLSPADLLCLWVDGGQIHEPISAGRIAAAKRLRVIEGTVKDWHGGAGLSLTRAVLTGGKSVNGRQTMRSVMM